MGWEGVGEGEQGGDLEVDVDEGRGGAEGKGDVVEDTEDPGHTAHADASALHPSATPLLHRHLIAPLEPPLFTTLSNAFKFCTIGQKRAPPVTAL